MRYNEMNNYHLLSSKLSHSAVSSLYKALLRRSLANSRWTVDSRRRDILALIIVAANANTSTNHASDKPTAPIIHAIIRAIPRYNAPRMASASLCKK